MKKIFSLTVAALLACTVFAQDYNRVTIGYQSLTPHNNTKFISIASDGTLDGFKIGYTHGFSLASEAPFYLEVGADFNYNGSSSDITVLSSSLKGVKYKRTNTTCAITVPISMAYKFDLTNGMWIQPYAGAILKYNISGRTKHKFKNAPTLKNASMNWFNKNDMSKEDISDGEGGILYNYQGGDACKRFQFGGQVGINIGYKNVNLNVAYQMHTPLQKTHDFKITTRAFTVGVGYNF